MTMPWIRRLVPLFSSVTCALLLGCGGDAPGSTTSTGTTVAGGAGSNTNNRLVIHMTGLLLMVPANNQNEPVNLLLPKDSSHTSWLGFGMEGDTSYAPFLCVGDSQGLRARRSDLIGDSARAAGICYVDLDSFTVSPLGRGGSPPTNTGNTFPPGLVNVTSLSGWEHMVDLDSIAGDYRSRLVFLTGQPDTTFCTLGNWRVIPVTSQGNPRPARRDDLVNGLSWEITGGQIDSLEFIRKNTGSQSPVRVALPVNNRKREILVAHVPTNELYHLPPGKAPAPIPQSAPDSVSHFKAYYNLLRSRGGPPPESRRPVPREPRNLRTRPCGASISVASGRGDKGRLAVGTYACVMASATLK
jgi:hypothetical protein